MAIHCACGNLGDRSPYGGLFSGAQYNACSIFTDYLLTSYGAPFFCEWGGKITLYVAISILGLVRLYTGLQRKI